MISRPIPARYFRFSPTNNVRYLDRWGRFLDKPLGAFTKTRIGIFGITVSKNQKFLVTYPRHALDIPGLPGGGREGYETHAQTLQREYFEELGPYFLIKKNIRLLYQQRILHYASDADEYWHYDQYFYIAAVQHPMRPCSTWDSPEGGLAKWLPLREYQRITAAHRPAIVRYMNITGVNGRTIVRVDRDSQ